MNFLRQIITQILALWQKLTIRQRITIIAVVIVFFATLFLLIYQARQANYSLLYSNLELEEAGEIVNMLKEKNIPYQLKERGKAIFVPSSQVYDIRLQLAMEGIPDGGKIGFEIFDNTNILGMTQFVEKINYQRALQGELARTIQSLSEIVESRVHLVIPEPTPFLEEKKPPRASVVLKLRPGVQLGKNQIWGIAHLVASSVEDLGTENITIIDGKGNMLFGGEEQNSPVFLTGNQLEIKREIEEYLANKIYSLLTPLLGPNKVVARVDAKMNFDQIRKTQEQYDPRGKVVQREMRREETKKGTSSLTGGSPGVKTNLGESQPGIQNIPGEESSEESSLEYAVNKTVEHIVKEVGNIEQLSIAVAIDGLYQLNQNGVKEYLPRTQEEMDKFTSIIQEAVGYTESRGDTITITNIPFDTSYEEEQQIITQKLARQELLKYLIKYIPIGISIFILFLLIRLLNLREIIAPQGKKETIPSKLETELEKEKKEIEEEILPPEQERLIEEHIFELAQNKPEQVVQIIKEWLTNHGSKNDNI